MTTERTGNRLSADDKVGAALLLMIRRTEEAQERAARTQGLHPTDFRCIGHLSERNEPVSPKEIANYLGLTSGSVTALLDRLARLGYIRRIHNPRDRRSVLVVLDRQAAAGPLAVFKRVQRKYAAATSAFSEEDLEKIARYLRQVAQLAEEMNETLYQADVTEIGAA